MSGQIWLVTATTSGLGAALVEHLAAQGHRVIASGRNANKRLPHLATDNVAVLDLDVKSSRNVLKAKIEKAWNIWGHIDVLYNNAGVSAPKAIEEAEDDWVQDMFEVNLFGNLRVTQSILPYFRARGQGTIAFTGAGVSWGPISFLSHYAASKSALGIFVEGLAKETAPFNIRCIIFEPGGFPSKLGAPREGATDGFGLYQPSIESYQPLFDETMADFATKIMPSIPGDVDKMAKCIVNHIHGVAEHEGRGKPCRVILGSDALQVIELKCKQQLDLCSSWEDVSLSTDKEGHDHKASEDMLRMTALP